jgi:hypothetical protein
MLSTSTWIWILTIGVGVLGIILIIAASWLNKDKIPYHIARDIGIALLVACIVSSIYEIHTRSILDLARIESVLKTVLASNIPKEAWEQVNTEILQRTVIRRNFEIRLRLRSDPNLSVTQRVLALETSYDLQGLRSQAVKYTLQHAVDREMWNESLGLPRFESVTIGKETLTGDVLRSHVDAEGVFALPNIELQSQNPLHVVVRRSEITNKPGTYHLILPELTQGIKVYFDEVPSDIDPDVKIWSDKGFATLQPAGNGIWYFEGVMLPGQALSFRFKNR